jgi:hypothetical protein
VHSTARPFARGRDQQHGGRGHRGSRLDKGLDSPAGSNKVLQMTADPSNLSPLFRPTPRRHWRPSTSPPVHLTPPPFAAVTVAHPRATLPSSSNETSTSRVPDRSDRGARTWPVPGGVTHRTPNSMTGPDVTLRGGDDRMAAEPPAAARRWSLTCKGAPGVRVGPRSGTRCRDPRRR